MSTDGLWQLDAWEIADLVRRGDVSALEVLDIFARRIEAYNEELNAIVFLDLERARLEAKDVDRRVGRGEDPGPLAGVPVGIKDLEDVAGMPTTYGSLLYRSNVAAADGVQTARLRLAGAVIVGKTATPEFGAEALTRTHVHGTTRNPWRHNRTPGGSSGGSAAAVASAMLPIASGSDGGGSIRIPASYTGLVGVKGTFGRIPKEGPDSSHTSVLGCLARSVRDTARYWDAVVGAHELDPHSLPHPGWTYEAIIDDLPDGLRATWSDDLGYQRSRADILEATRKAAQTLCREAGIELISRAVELKDMSSAWGLLNHPATWLRIREAWPERASEMTPVIRASASDAERRYDVREVARAIERRAENDRRLAEVFAEVDLIFTPTTGTTAFPAEGPMPTEIDGEPIKPMHSLYTYPFNVSGHPAASVPCGLDADGLPIGLQIVARRHADHLVMQVARAFERRHPWPKIAPDYA